MKSYQEPESWRKGISLTRGFSLFKTAIEGSDATKDTVPGRRDSRKRLG